MIRRLSVFCLLCLALCFGRELQARQGADSLRFQSLIDSMISLKASEKFTEGIQLGQLLYDEARQSDDIYFALEALYNLSSLRHYNSQFDEAREEALNCIQLAEEEEYYHQMVRCANQLALIYFNLSLYDSAEVYYKVAMETAIEHVPERSPVAIANMAFIHGVMDHREQELDYFMQALAVVEAHPEYPRGDGVSAMAYSSLGDYYLSIREFENARENFEKKLALGEKLNSRRIMYEAHGGLGQLYATEGYYDFEKSKGHLEIPASEDDPDYGHYKNQSVVRLARLYRKEGAYQQSLKHFMDAYTYYSGRVGADFKSAIETEVGEVYMKTNELSIARQWLNKGLASALEKNLFSRERNALSGLYKLDSMQGRFASALGRYQRMKLISDSLSSERTRNRINELQIQYETEQTEKENLTLKSDLELKQAQVDRQRAIQAFVILVAVAMIVLALVIQRNYKRKKRDHDIISSQANELQELSRFKQGLTSMVVHDMRNPINAIIGFSQGTPTEKKLKSINQSGHKVLNLVTNMLDIQRFEEAQVELEEEVLDWRDLVIDTANEVHLLLQAKSIRLENRIPKGLLVRADRVLMGRVIINLITNAIKYSRAGASVYMELGESADGRQELIVRDEGSGIPEDQMPYIFNKFWHTDYSKSGVLPSTGLGLSFCKLAVEAHGGTIRAVSSPGQGTSMIFTLPLSANTAIVSGSRSENGEMTVQETLSESDINNLRPFLPDLQKLQVHEVSAINKLIREMEHNSVDKKWAADLQNAVYQGDQERYDALLSMIRQEELI